MFSTPFTFMKATEGGAWSPLDLPGIENWFKADTGITLVSTKVSVWQDSLTAKSVTQSTDAQRPTFTASNANFNGLPTVDFINTGGPLNFLRNDTDFQYSASFPLYIFFVLRKTLNNSSFNFSGGGSDANDPASGAWSVDISDSGIRAWTDGVSDGFTNTTTGTTLDTTILAGMGITTTNSLSFLNNNSDSKAETAISKTNTKFIIGGYDTAEYNFQGSIAEVIISRGVELSGTDLTDLYSYVETKYAI